MVEFSDELICRECERRFDNAEGVRRHQRVHGGYETYVLKWKWNGKRPTCLCGCGIITGWNVAAKDYARYAVDHGGKSTIGRARTNEEKRSIGAKNAINTKNYFDKNPEAMMRQVRSMHNAVTADVITRRINSTREAYQNLSDEHRQWFRDHAAALWRKRRPMMEAARTKALSTFRERLANGQYDFTTRNENLSKAITNLYLDGGFCWSVGEYTSAKTGETIFYRSSWELEYAKILDADTTVATWQYEPLAIEYIYKSKVKRYLPDFLVCYTDGTKELVEVKPKELVTNDVNQAKRNAAIKVCNDNGWQYVFWSSQGTDS